MLGCAGLGLAMSVVAGIWCGDEDFLFLFIFIYLFILFIAGGGVWESLVATLKGNLVIM